METATVTAVEAGPFTQLVTNIQTMVQQLAAITPLPELATMIQTEVVGLGNSLWNSVATAQQQGRQFVSSAGALTENAVSNRGAAQATTDLQQIQSQAQALEPEIQNAMSIVTAFQSQVNSWIGRLQQLEPTLSGNLAAAEAQRSDDQQEVNALNQKKYYWLALGPLGLIGLGVAIGELVTANKKVASIQSQINAINLQITQTQNMSRMVAQLQSDLTPLAASLQALKNAISFITGDLNSVMLDANFAAVAGTFLMAMSGELQKLNTDLS